LKKRTCFGANAKARSVLLQKYSGLRRRNIDSFAAFRRKHSARSWTQPGVEYQSLRQPRLAQAVEPKRPVLGFAITGASSTLERRIRLQREDFLDRDPCLVQSAEMGKARGQNVIGGDVVWVLVDRALAPGNCVAKSFREEMSESNAIAEIITVG